MKASLPLRKNRDIRMDITGNAEAHIVIWDKNDAKKDKSALAWRFLYRVLIIWQLFILHLNIITNHKYHFLFSYVFLGVLIVVYNDLIKPKADEAVFRKMIKANKWFPNSL